MTLSYVSQSEYLRMWVTGVKGYEWKRHLKHNTKCGNLQTLTVCHILKWNILEEMEKWICPQHLTCKLTSYRLRQIQLMYLRRPYALIGLATVSLVSQGQRPFSAGVILLFLKTLHLHYHNLYAVNRMAGINWNCLSDRLAACCLQLSERICRMFLLSHWRLLLNYSLLRSLL